MRIVYNGLPNRIRFDHSTCFEDEFYTVASGAQISLGGSGLETHTRLGIEESFH